MISTTKKFIEIAYKAMQMAYESESEGMTKIDKETAKKVGEVLQAVGDLSRMP